MKKPFSLMKLLGLLLILMFAWILSLSVGSSDISAIDSIKLVCAKIPVVGQFIDISEYSPSYLTIIWKVRFPRICLSSMVGAGLALAGCAYQGIFQNPLSDPYILGASSGAALFATVAVVSGLSFKFLGLGTIGIFAFIGAVVTIILVYFISRIGGEISMTNMLLSGTAISTMLSAVISLILIFNRDQMSKVYMWTMGSFTAATWEKVLFELIFLVVATAVLMLFCDKLNVLLLGEEEAGSMGINVKNTHIIVILTASLLVASSVAVSGIIGFVGLIIPHSVRLVTGSDNKKVMPYSAAVGAIFLVICDTLARTIVMPSEIPIGIITAICGAPYFIFLVCKK